MPMAMFGFYPECDLSYFKYRTQSAVSFPLNSAVMVKLNISGFT